MWEFRQASGVLYDPTGAIAGVGYSGAGTGKNNPSAQDQPNVGPIPCGEYAIGEAFTHPEKGPFVMRLEPDPANQTTLRAGFMIHGDSVSAPGHASEGCIILGLAVRQKLAGALDRGLTVIA